MLADRFAAGPALEPLKAFQRRTVDYVFDRLYTAQQTTRQFLVADEVGLGKTMVARGVIARAVEHLWDTTKRIDILYICSNQAIAAQNINRLNVLGRQELTLPTRMTLIPLQVGGGDGLDGNKVNFISLTPGTTFDLRSATGVAQERALLLRMLADLVSRPRGLHNLLQVGAGVDGWNWVVRSIDLKDVDRNIIARFRSDVRADRDLHAELERVCEMFGRRRNHYPLEMTQPRNSLVARLRGKLSHACVESLQPDLIILDEFQRFRDLLHGDSDAAVLARELFDYSSSGGHQARTLLLSATPYRMLTLAGDDPDEGEHYKDFLDTLSFLYGKDEGPAIADILAREMGAFRGFLRTLPGSRAAAVEARDKVESRLCKVMTRTERVDSTADRDSMVTEPPMRVSVEPGDLHAAAAMADVGRALGAPDITEYWKSAPYLLNFMRDYVLKDLLKDCIAAPSDAVREAVRRACNFTLRRDSLDIYEPADPANGRMRALMSDVFDEQLEQNLWIPAALPYYEQAISGPPLTKALVFSSWSMVPDSIAALLSYEAERRMGVGQTGQRYFDRVRPRPLQFREDRGRLAGMRAMLLIYPSPTLARLGDPLAIFADHPRPLSLEEVRTAVAERLRPSFEELRGEAYGTADGHGWEWAAPAALDGMLGVGAASGEWFPPELSSPSTEDSGLMDHLDEHRRAAERRDFGPLADNVLDLLTDVCLGSPAVCALRSLHRVAPDLGWDDPRLLQAATQVSWGFRTLFNQHDAVAMLRRGDDDRYWHLVLTYSAQHNLQAVLDEYVHYLVDAEGLGSCSSGERVAGLAVAMLNALSIRPSQIEADELSIEGGAIKLTPLRMRGRFAMRLADYRDEDGAVARLGGVRDAFNSPFRPFVLATTSVGQEGLDFHPYCHRVYHWNLPGNPVDLEQREGRVHRYKGHAVRLNLASRYADAIRRPSSALGDPWEIMFEEARRQTDIDTGLVPYWIVEGPVKVERRVPILPFSREVTRLAWLKRSLAVYRLAFGQPRQDDLLDYLNGLVGAGVDLDDLVDLQISLAPPSATQFVNSVIAAEAPIGGGGTSADSHGTHSDG